jgi:hypothetical protein
MTPDNLTSHLYEFMYDGQTGAEINGAIITLHFVDGKRGDHDLMVNGRVTDPVALGIKENQPTAITLASLRVQPGNRIVTISWQTGDETDNLGFNIYRAEAKEGNYEKINTSFIPSRVGSGLGATYEFLDSSVNNRTAYFYKLEDVDINGKHTMHGPVTATPRLIYGIGK